MQAETVLIASASAEWELRSDLLWAKSKTSLRTKTPGLDIFVDFSEIKDTYLSCFVLFFSE